MKIAHAITSRSRQLIEYRNLRDPPPPLGVSELDLSEAPSDFSFSHYCVCEPLLGHHISLGLN